MNMDHLGMFCLVVDEGSISQAARLNYISQPAVTNQIRQVENYYGTDLFHRTDGRLTLTKAGEKLYPFAKEMIDHLQRSEEAVGVRKIIHKTFLAHGVSANISSFMELGSTQAIKSAVEAGLGISILPKLSVQQELMHRQRIHIPKD